MKNLILKLLRYVAFIRYYSSPSLYYKKQLNCYDLYNETSINNCFRTFSEYFFKAIFLSNNEVRKYSIKNANLEGGLFLEFGVFEGESINFFSSHINDQTIYGFDTFEGLIEDWKGKIGGEKGLFNLDGKLPDVNSNVKLIKGKVQNTLDNFLDNEAKNKKINFVHLDLDTYESTLYVLKKIKPYMNSGCILLFDELYNFPGWEVGEYKALNETFDLNKELEFLVFSSDGPRVTLRYLAK